MNELLTHIWNYESILAHAAAGNNTGAAEVAATALIQARAQLEAYEEWAERQHEAELTWAAEGAALVAELESGAYALPF